LKINYVLVIPIYLENLKQPSINCTIVKNKLLTDIDPQHYTVVKGTMNIV
jgi:hypothetical protein